MSVKIRNFLLRNTSLHSFGASLHLKSSRSSSKRTSSIDNRRPKPSWVAVENAKTCEKWTKRKQSWRIWKIRAQSFKRRKSQKETFTCNFSEHIVSCHSKNRCRVLSKSSMTSLLKKNLKSAKSTSWQKSALSSWILVRAISKWTLASGGISPTVPPKNLTIYKVHIWRSSWSHV
jgi:hypothetical protein